MHRSRFGNVGIGVLDGRWFVSPSSSSAAVSAIVSAASAAASRTAASTSALGRAVRSADHGRRIEALERIEAAVVVGNGRGSTRRLSPTARARVRTALGHYAAGLIDPGAALARHFATVLLLIGPVQIKCEILSSTCAGFRSSGRVAKIRSNE